jgi:hypothetical protein
VLPVNCAGGRWFRWLGEERGPFLTKYVFHVFISASVFRLRLTHLRLIRYMADQATEDQQRAAHQEYSAEVQSAKQRFEELQADEEWKAENCRCGLYSGGV